MGKNLISQINLAAMIPGTTGSSVASMAQLDMDGYEGAFFLGYIESTGASAQLIVKAGSATGSMSELTGPSGGEASGITNRLYVDVFRPKQRYLEGRVVTSAAAGKNTFVIGLRYGGRNLAATQDTATWQGRELFTPNTGTATATG